MAFNKAKALATAQRFIDKGQLKRALGPYQKLCAADPADTRSRLRMGDLYHKTGELAGALKAYNDVARSFAEQGMLLKSVAVYKQMLRMDWGLHSVHVALARVYHQLGLVNDAVSQYQDAIRVLSQRGKVRQRLYVIRELLELDADNVRARVRLAEDFATEGLKQDAVRELRLAAESLDRDGRTEEFMRVAERLLYHQPDDAIVSRRLAELYLDEDSPQQALPRLQACFRAHPADVEVLDMLARAFDKLGQTHKSLTVLKELARIHDRNGLIDERDDALSRVLAIDPSDQSARAALAGRQEEDVAPDEIGFGEITFDALEDEDVREDPPAERENSPMPAPSPTPSPAAFDDLEALADLVASEPVSQPNIDLSGFDTRGLSPSPIRSNVDLGDGGDEISSLTSALELVEDEERAASELAPPPVPVFVQAHEREPVPEAAVDPEVPLLIDVEDLDGLTDLEFDDEPIGESLDHEMYAEAVEADEPEGRPALPSVQEEGSQGLEADDPDEPEVLPLDDADPADALDPETMEQIVSLQTATIEAVMELDELEGEPSIGPQGEAFESDELTDQDSPVQPEDAAEAAPDGPGKHVDDETELEPSVAFDPGEEEVELEEIELEEIELEEVELEEIELEEIELEEIELEEVEFEEAEPDSVELDLVALEEVELEEFTLDAIELEDIDAGEIEPAEIEREVDALDDASSEMPGELNRRAAPDPDPREQESPDSGPDADWIEVIVDGEGQELVAVDDVDGLAVPAIELEEAEPGDVERALTAEIIESVGDEDAVELDLELDVEFEDELESDDDVARSGLEEFDAALLVDAADPPVQDPVPSALAGELREFDFYLQNGLPDAARSVLEDLPPDYATHPEVVSRRTRLES